MCSLLLSLFVVSSSCSLLLILSCVVVVVVLCAYNSCCSFFMFVVLDLVAEASSCLILDTAQDIHICPMKQSFLDAPGHSVCSLFLNLVFEFEVLGSFSLLLFSSFVRWLCS